MKTQPRASVIVPVHNAASTIAHAIDNLKLQTADNFEVLLVNDGSTDGTQSVLARLVEGDSRFRLLYQENAGPGVARNTGIAAARGEYAMFMDADDSIKPTFVERAMDVARDTDADIVCFQMNLLDARDGAIHDSEERWIPECYPDVFDPVDFADNLFCTFRNWPVDKAFKLSFLRKERIRFPALYRTEDLAFTCSALARARHIALLDECLYTYLIGTDSSSTATRDAHPCDYYEGALALKQYLESTGLMEVFAFTYHTWVGLCVTLNLVELATPEGYAQAHAMVADGGLARLGIYANDYLDSNTKAAGEFTYHDVRMFLEALENGNAQTSCQAAAALAADVAGRVRRTQYVDEYGSTLGPLLETVTRPLHALTHHIPRYSRQNSCDVR